MRFFPYSSPYQKTGGVLNAIFFGWGIFCTSVLLLSYCCTIVQYDETKATVTPNPAKQLQVLLNPRIVLLMYYHCTTVLLLYYCTTTVLLLYYYCTTTVLLLYYCTTTALLLHYYCTITVLLLYYYCTTTVPYQASDVVGVQVGGKSLQNEGFLVLVVILE